MYVRISVQCQYQYLCCTESSLAMALSTSMDMEAASDMAQCQYQ